MSEELNDVNLLLALPLEIFHRILGDLPILDRIRTERVCRGWKRCSTERIWRDVQALYIISSDCKWKYHKFNNSASKSHKFIMMEDNKVYVCVDEPEVIKSLVRRAGKHIKKLICNFDRDDRETKAVLLNISTHCNNIEVIQLLRIGNSVINAFSRILQCNQKLHSITCVEADALINILPMRNWKSLHIGMANLEEAQLDTQLVPLIKNSPTLEEFEADHWTPNLVAAISKCEELKILHFPRLTETAAHDLMMNTSLLNRLTCLRIAAEGGQDSSIIELLGHCKNVESLGLYYGSDKVLPMRVLKAVMDLPKLESLDLDATSVTDDILSSLRKFKNLRFNGYLRSFTEGGIFDLIIQSHFLETLKMPRMKMENILFRKLVRKIGKSKILTIEVPHEIYEKAFKICKDSYICIIEESEYF